MAFKDINNLVPGIFVIIYIILDSRLQNNLIVPLKPLLIGL